MLNWAETWVKTSKHLHSMEESIWNDMLCLMLYDYALEWLLMPETCCCVIIFAVRVLLIWFLLKTDFPESLSGLYTDRTLVCSLNQVTRSTRCTIPPPTSTLQEPSDATTPCTASARGKASRSTTRRCSSISSTTPRRLDLWAPTMSRATPRSWSRALKLWKDTSAPWPQPNPKWKTSWRGTSCCGGRGFSPAAGSSRSAAARSKRGTLRWKQDNKKEKRNTSVRQLWIESSIFM